MQSNYSGKLNNVEKMYNVTFSGDHKSPSSTTRTIDVALNHDSPTVGQPTEQTPDTFSIVDTTERVVELEVVNNVLLPHHKNTDKERHSDKEYIYKSSLHNNLNVDLLCSA